MVSVQRPTTGTGQSDWKSEVPGKVNLLAFGLGMNCWGHDWDSSLPMRAGIPHLTSTSVRGHTEALIMPLPRLPHSLLFSSPVLLFTTQAVAFPMQGHMEAIFPHHPRLPQCLSNMLLSAHRTCMLQVSVWPHHTLLRWWLTCTYRLHSSCRYLFSFRDSFCFLMRTFRLQSSVLLASLVALGLSSSYPGTLGNRCPALEKKWMQIPRSPQSSPFQSFTLFACPVSFLCLL